MTQAITTTYHGPSNSRGALITARTGRKGDPTVTIGYHSYEGDARSRHEAAAAFLALRLDWHGRWASGDLAPGKRVHVLLPPGYFDFTFHVRDKESTNAAAGAEAWFTEAWFPGRVSKVLTLGDL